MMKPKRRITESYFETARKQYSPLIHRQSLRVATKRKQIEELKSIALDELLKCMICYDSRGSFMTFFHGRLYYAFTHARDADHRACRANTMPDNSIQGITAPCQNMDVGIMIQECFDCLNQEERDVVTEIYFNNKTMREISLCRGVHATTIYRIKTRAIEKMRQKHGIGVK